MKVKTILAGTCVLAFATFAAAQNKVSGTAQCGKPDVRQMVEVSDHPGHMLMITQAKCTWSKPLEVDGVQSKDGLDSGVGEMHGGTGTSHGYYIDTMANGDKSFVKWQGTDSMKEGSSGKWSYVGGTGKFKGLKGGGTYKGKMAEDGSVTFDVEGEYTLGK